MQSEIWLNFVPPLALICNLAKRSHEAKSNQPWPVATRNSLTETILSHVQSFFYTHTTPLGTMELIVWFSKHIWPLWGQQARFDGDPKRPPRLLRSRMCIEKAEKTITTPAGSHVSEISLFSAAARVPTCCSEEL